MSHFRETHHLAVRARDLKDAGLQGSAKRKKGVKGGGTQLVPAEDHDSTCLEYRARVCTTPIECEHGYDVCPQCDPCTCAIQASPNGEKNG